ncbi:MAG TPA: nucleotidyltransferase domain-containing protein [Candidatus Hydrogenedentes bacterium]|nr:nucleotidyltransferase domain-containing protein [Candidatus Hydrogenedentota bacterium]
MSPQVQSEIKTAVDILLRHGASEVFVFGSHARDTASPFSDLDLAIRGMPPENFYRAVGEVCAALSVPADIVDLDESSPALDYLKEHGDFLRVA